MSTPSPSIPRPSMLTLPNKSSAPLSYTFIPALLSQPRHPTTSGDRLVIFLNGLGLPASSWIPSLEILLQERPIRPAVLTYDRFGQGLTTSGDPNDEKHGKEFGHDYVDVVEDLRAVIKEIIRSKLKVTDGPENVELLIVAHSIGCNIARLYAQSHPGMVAGLILLDSNIASANYSDIWPDPSSASFDTEILVKGECTMEEYIEAKEKLARMFDFGIKNAENFDRRNSRELLPDPGRPKLIGVLGGPEVIVVGHDPETFEDVSLELSGTPKGLTRALTDPYWKRYNEQLRNITDEGKCGEVVIAKGCGHFIQKDDPAFVAMQVVEMLDRLNW